MGEFRDKTLADAIMFKAWEIFEDPALTGPFLEHVAVRLRQYGELCRGTDFTTNEAFRSTAARGYTASAAVPYISLPTGDRALYCLLLP